MCRRTRRFSAIAAVTGALGVGLGDLLDLAQQVEQLLAVAHEVAGRHVGLGEDLVQGASTRPVEDRAREASGATVVRVIRPGQAVTRDFNQSRINLQLDSYDVVVRAYCG